MQDSQTVEIYSAADASDAHLVRMHLEEEGIVAHVVGDALGIGGFPVGNANPRVWVHAADEERARAVLADWEAHRRTHQGAAADEAEDDAEVEESELDANES